MKNILEAILMASDEPLSLDKLVDIFAANMDNEEIFEELSSSSKEEETFGGSPPLNKGGSELASGGFSKSEIQALIESLQEDYKDRGIELKKLSSGYAFQTRSQYSIWVTKLFQTKPPKYSRALLETLALIAYRQPITRPEIEAIRGVAVSSHIIKTLLDRDWIRIAGHRDVPGKPTLFATTTYFLDYFNLHKLGDLPPLESLSSLLSQMNMRQENIESTISTITPSEEDERRRTSEISE